MQPYHRTKQNKNKHFENKSLIEQKIVYNFNIFEIKINVIGNFNADDTEKNALQMKMVTFFYLLILTNSYNSSYDGSTNSKMNPIWKIASEQFQ